MWGPQESMCAKVLLGFVVVMINFSSLPTCQSLHVYGTWDPDEDFFLFLSKFGFQKTELTNKNDTQGFIFGNITSVILERGLQLPISSVAGGKIAPLPVQLIPKVRVPRDASAGREGVGSGKDDDVKLASSAAPVIVSSTGPPKFNISASKASGAAENIKEAQQDNSEHKTSSSVPPLPNKVFSETFVTPSSKLPEKTHINFSSPNTSTTKLSLTPLPRTSTTAVSSTAGAVKTSVSSTTSTTTTTTRAPTKSSTTSAPASSSSTTSKPTTSKTTTTTAAASPPQFYPATLVVLDKGFFIDFYKGRLIKDKDAACKRMFDRISHVAHDPVCYPEGTEKLLRRVPCTKKDICPDDKLANESVVKDHQFTYAISDLSKAKFWYVSLVACFRNPVTCEWEYSRNNSPVDYDLWLVNGNPYTKNQNPLEYQFSFDRQDTVEIYLIFFLCYLILVPLQIHAVLRQRHIVPKLFTASVALELTAVTSNVVHVLKFALNGEGHPGLAIFGDVMDIIARAIFMLILLVLAKGWAVTRTELTSKPFIFSIWAVYGVVHILLYVWKETEVDVIEDIDEYQTWPGWLILILRTIIMIWFLYELKDTMDHEHQPHKLNFFLHFGAAALVWFIYLPIVALIALQVSPLWRSKFLLGITYSADCLAFAIMTHLLWPTRTEQYFLLMSKEAILTDELEEFNEAPHVVNSYVRRPNHWYPVNYSFHDVSSPEAVSLTQGNTVQNFHHQYPHQRFSNGSNGFVSDDVKDNVPLIIT